MLLRHVNHTVPAPQATWRELPGAWLAHLTAIMAVRCASCSTGKRSSTMKYPLATQHGSRAGIPTATTSFFRPQLARLLGANNRLIRGAAHVQLAFVPQGMQETLALLNRKPFLIDRFFGRAWPFMTARLARKPAIPRKISKFFVTIGGFRVCHSAHGFSGMQGASLFSTASWANRGCRPFGLAAGSRCSRVRCRWVTSEIASVCYALDRGD